jgi:hypothetical protein
MGVDPCENPYPVLRLNTVDGVTAIHPFFTRSVPKSNRRLFGCPTAIRHTNINNSSMRSFIDRLF